MEYTEYIIKYSCSRFNRKWNFAQHFPFCALSRLAYLPKVALQMVALVLLNVKILVTFL